jgi:hypothetical protein
MGAQLPLSTEPDLATRYALLVERLKEGAHKLRDGEDPLLCAHFQLQTVLTFLSLDRALNGSDSYGPLMKLYGALHDVRQGGHPALFASQSKGRPRNKFNLYPRSFLAAAVDVLIDQGGISPRDAVEWLRKEIRTSKALDTVPSAKDLLRWREDARSAQWPEEQVDVFQALQRIHLDTIGNNAAGRRRADAERRVRSILAMFTTGRFPKN